MQVSVADAKDKLSQLIRAVESGEPVIITRNGKPVAELRPAVKTRREVRWGSMRGEFELEPGWDKPISEEQFFSGEF